MKKIVLSTVIFILLAAFGLCWYFGRPVETISAIVSTMPKYQLSYTSHNTPETNQLFDHVDNGFYQIFGYTLKDQIVYPTPQDVPVHTNDDEVLVLIQINLCNFTNRPLTDNALNQLYNILKAYSTTSPRLILRFLYDWNGTASLTEPTDITMIQTHMEQVSEIYNSFKDRIYILQGLFTGNHGEMNGSHFTDASGLITLYETLNRVTDPCIFLAVRTPAQWRAIANGLGNDTSALSRLGLFNDGLLGSETDLGTYTEGSREEEMLFQQSLCAFVPNGGEAVVPNPLNDFSSAMEAFSQMHITYLNSAYDLNVLAKWKDTTYHSNDCYDGMSGYDYINMHLGYRYVLRDSLLKTEAEKETVSLLIENVGFGSCYHPIALTVHLFSDEGYMYSITTNHAGGELPGGQVTSLDFTLPMDELPAGTYRLTFELTDLQTNELLPLANECSLETMGYPAGEITLYRRLSTLPRNK